MKILKKGGYFKAYCTETYEKETRFQIGDHMGTISIKTGKFNGATACLIELNEKLDSHKSEQIDKAKKLLEDNGYYTGNLWQVDDVRGKFKCSDEEAMRVLDKALQNEATMEQIWFAIGWHGEDIGLTEILEE